MHIPIRIITQDIFEGFMRNDVQMAIYGAPALSNLQKQGQKVKLLASLHHARSRFP